VHLNGLINENIYTAQQPKLLYKEFFLHIF